MSTQAKEFRQVNEAVLAHDGPLYADVGGDVVGNEGGLFAVALLLGLIFIGFGSISMLPPRGRRRH